MYKKDAFKKTLQNFLIKKKTLQNHFVMTLQNFITKSITQFL